MVHKFNNMDRAFGDHSDALLFIADIHGNQSHVQKCLNLCVEQNIKYLVFGGDLSPKSPKKRTPARQYDFFTKKFLPTIERYRNAGLNSEITAIFGNDDFSDNFDEVKKIALTHGVNIASNDIIPLSKSIALICYSFVPPTPFKYKDWEKFDIAYTDERECTFDGFVFRKSGKEDIFIDNFYKRGSIEKDLDNLFKKAYEHYECAVLASHAPPFDTNLDATFNSGHVGSVSIQRMIKKHKPMFTLHGHIHEAREVSGFWFDKIGKTYSFNPSNKFDSPIASMIRVPISDPRKTQHYEIGGEKVKQCSYGGLAVRRQRFLKLLKNYRILIGLYKMKVADSRRARHQP